MIIFNADKKRNIMKTELIRDSITHVPRSKHIILSPLYNIAALCYRPKGLLIIAVLPYAPKRPRTW